MANIRSLEQIIAGMLDYYRIKQPDADTKPGTVIRDLFIEAPATQLSILYDELSGISNKQSIRLASGTDLDKLAKNFGLTRRQSTSATGIALLTFSSINSPVSINSSGIIVANNGITFFCNTSTVVSPESSNFYKSIASKYKDQLSFAGITDQYAVEVSITSNSTGEIGNIGKFSLSSTTINGVSNITNINQFSGGTDVEGDAAFRDRVLGSFNGASVGTSLGYLNSALSVNGVIDSRVIEPGNILMTRDGTVVKNISGKDTIVSEGSGGKVDLIILGSILTENSESYIFKNKSNDNNITNIKNDIILGQIPGDQNKTINKKRADNIKNETLPSQPVEKIMQISGSVSGSNFKEKTSDIYGRVYGNYELVKDKGEFAGSAWSFDKLHWISNNVNYQEDKVKGKAYGQDSTTYTEVIEIPSIEQSISIRDENSIITQDRSIIQLLHTPATNITKVVNLTTGERYIVSNNNLDKTPEYNLTGRIKINGNTLPSNSDILQVDYNWIVEYDQYSDYDGLKLNKNNRNSVDSIDWGYSSQVKDEMIEFNSNSNYFTGFSQFPISSIISVCKFNLSYGTVSKINEGIYSNNLYVDVVNLQSPATEISSIKTISSNKELFKTAQSSGSFFNFAEVVGSDVFYTTRIILPSDTSASVGDKVLIHLDDTDVFNVNNVLGSSNGNIITISSSSVDTENSKIIMKVSYIANVSELFSGAISSLPATKKANGFTFSNVINESNISNSLIKENQIVQRNLSNQFYVDLNLNSLDFNLSETSIVSVIKLSDGTQYWDSNVSGTILTNSLNTYQIVLDGYNLPSIGDRVLITYSPISIRKFQPFSFQNKVLKHKTSTLDYDTSINKFFININAWEDVLSNLSFEIFDENTQSSVLSANDGYLISDGYSAKIYSLSSNFSTIFDIQNKKLIIKSNLFPSNNGDYNISSIDNLNNFITINNNYIFEGSNLSITRVLNNKELWNENSYIDIPNNRLVIGNTATAVVGDLVEITLFEYNNLIQMPTRLIAKVSDQVLNSGVLSIVGTTFHKAKSIVFNASNSGLKINLAEAIKKDLNLPSSSDIPSFIKVIKIIKLEKVSTISSSNDEVISILNTFDTLGSKQKNNSLYSKDILSDLSLSNFDIVLPNTINNLNDKISIGDKLRATFYYIKENNIENLSFVRNDTVYSNNKFAIINKIYVSSGFNSSQSAKLTISSFTQPSQASKYKVKYNYIAPKTNERISINYNYNRLISDVSFNIENTRPINADVLVKAAQPINLDLTMNIVIEDDYKISSDNIVKSLKDRFISELTSEVLGDIVDGTSLITIAESIKGIARARIIYFNKSGEMGKVLLLQAKENEYFISNNIIINTESR